MDGTEILSELQNLRSDVDDVRQLLQQRRTDPKHTLKLQALDEFNLRHEIGLQVWQPFGDRIPVRGVIVAGHRLDYSVGMVFPADFENSDGTSEYTGVLHIPLGKRIYSDDPAMLLRTMLDEFANHDLTHDQTPGQIASDVLDWFTDYVDGLEAVDA